MLPRVYTKVENALFSWTTTLDIATQTQLQYVSTKLAEMELLMGIHIHV